MNARLATSYAESFPNCFVTLSVDILPEIREYERTSTTVINAYVGPPVRHYISSLVQRLAEAGISGAAAVDAVERRRARRRQRHAERRSTSSSAGPPPASSGRCASPRSVGGPTSSPSIWAAPRPRPRSSRSARWRAPAITRSGGGIKLSSRLVKGGGYALKRRSSTSRRSARAAAASSGSTRAASSRSGRTAPARNRAGVPTASAAPSRP